MKLFTTLAVCLFAISAFAADAPKNPMKPGKWEISTQMDMPGMQMPARTFTKCVTKEEAENPENAVPRGRQDSACKLSDVKVEGHTISWKMNCPERQMTGEGKATYEDDAYTGEMHVKSADHEMTMKYTGKRLGDCDAGK